MAPLEALGFALAGYGCTTCIGNSGPLDDAGRRGDRGERPRRRGGPLGQPQLRGPHPPARARQLPRLAAAGRRVRARRPGRHRPDDASRSGTGTRRPAGLPRRHLAGARRDPRGHRRRRSTRSCSGGPTRSCSRATSAGGRCRSRRATATPGTPARRTSRKPPFFDGLDARAARRSPTSSAPASLAVLGDSVTTDHISPAGSIAPWSPAGQWLQEHGVGAARVQLVRRAARPPRGDDARHVRQHPAAQPARRGQGGPVHASTCPTARRAFIYDAAMRYARRGRAARRPRRPRVRLRARRATGRPRAPALLGVRAVIAESYERIHRSNLVGMGVLPLQFQPGESAVVARPDRPRDVLDRRARRAGSTPRQPVTVVARDATTATRAPVRGHRPARRPDRGRLLPQRRDPAGRPAPPRTPRRLRESRRPRAAGSVPDISPRNQRQGCAPWSAVRHQPGSYLAVNWRRERPNPTAWDD